MSWRKRLDDSRNEGGVTRGIRGVIAWLRNAAAVEVESQPVDVVDTIGDSFQAGLLFALKTIGRIAPASLARMSGDELHRVLRFAATCAAFTCGRAGADPPRLAELGAERIRELLDRRRRVNRGDRL